MRKVDIEKLLDLFIQSEVVGRSVINTVDDEKLLKQIRERLQKQEGYDIVVSLIDDRIHLLEEKNKEPKPERYLSVRVLLKKIDDKSTRIAAARQLKGRFERLDNKDKILILDKFLGMTASYRKWCYMILREWREPKFDDRIVELWKKYKEPGAFLFILNILPEEKVKPLFDEIVVNINRKNYFHLIKRFGKSKWFKVDYDLLKNLCFNYWRCSK